jgi:hypothetical protein
VEALVLDKPVLVLNTPTNLRAMVEAGVALGVPAGEDPTDRLYRLLFDRGTRELLAAARASYRPEIAFGTDGGATARILGLVRAIADSRPGPPATVAGGHVRVMGP